MGIYYVKNTIFKRIHEFCTIGILKLMDKVKYTNEIYIYV